VSLVFILFCCCVFQWYDQNLGDTSSGVRWQNFVALGSGFPEGDTAYVLRLAVSVTGTLTAKLLYNAVTGYCYDLMDARSRDTCPLQSLALLFNADNVWANIQQDDDPTRTSFELGNPKCYRAFFTSKADGSGGFTREQAAQMYALSFATLQKSIHYTEEPLSYYVDRASRLERLVERRFEKWRAGTPTRWDYGVAGVLRDLLLAFETHAQGDDQTGGGGGVGGAGAVPGSALALAAERPLAQLQGAYASVQGFPLHFSDAGDSRLLSAAEDNAVLQAVRHTRIHECDERNAVFALAVYIHPYPNRIGSVWLYIACLIDK
jgi:coiled-coil and C2 domain-containing protein 2A